MKANLVMLSAAIACGSCAGSMKATPVRVAVQDLQDQEARLAGSILVTDGCLNVHQHGAYIQPCGHAGRESITLVSDPGNLIPGLFIKERGRLGGELEVVVTGSLVKVDNPAPGTGQRIYLEIRSIGVPPAH